MPFDSTGNSYRDGRSRDFFDFSTLEQPDAAIHSSRIDWATFDLKRAIPSRDGFLASTNHFVNPEWGLANPPGDPNNTTLRRNNLLVLGEKYKGKAPLALLETLVAGRLAQSRSIADQENIAAIILQALIEAESSAISLKGLEDRRGLDCLTIFLENAQMGLALHEPSTDTSVSFLSIRSFWSVSRLLA